MHYNAGNSHLLVNGKEILNFKFKVDNENLKFSMDLVLQSLDKYLEMEMCMTFQLITILLINLIY